MEQSDIIKTAIKNHNLSKDFNINKDINILMNLTYSIAYNKGWMDALKENNKITRATKQKQ